MNEMGYKIKEIGNELIVNLDGFQMISDFYV